MPAAVAIWSTVTWSNPCSANRSSAISVMRARTASRPISRRLGPLLVVLDMAPDYRRCHLCQRLTDMAYADTYRLKLRSLTMETRTLGRQGLTVSALGYGAMGTAAFYGPTDDTESIAAIRRAHDEGVTFFD